MTIDQNFVTTLAALALLIAAWIAVRVRLRQSPLHLWLGSACAAIVAVVANASHASAGTLADLVMIAASLFAGYLFTLGVRCEAKDNPEAYGAIFAGFAASLAVALLLELTVANDGLQISIMRLLIAAEYLSALLWIPELLRSTIPKPATTSLAVLAALVALAVVSRSSMAAVIVIAAVVMAAFSVGRARMARIRR